MTVIHNHCIKCIFNNKNRFHKILVVNNYFLLLKYILFKCTKIKYFFYELHNTTWF